MAFSLSSLCWGAPSAPVPGTPHIIPQPAAMRVKTGEAGFSLKDGVRLPEGNPLSKQAERIFRDNGIKTALVETGADLIFTEDASLGREGYRLAVTPDSISIASGSVNGALYALQSLVQSVASDVNGAPALPRLDVKDQPRFSWRGLMMDSCRHMMPVRDVKKILDLMERYKFNTLHWHLTDDVGWRIEIKKYPRLTTIGSRRRESETGTWNSGKSDGTPHEGFYTQEQIRDIVQYAARRNITIVPEIEMPGHASAAATAYPFLSLKSPREVPTTFIVNTAFDPTSEKTYAFLSDVLDEVVALFPSRIIHIGGDEVRYAQQWKDVPEIEAFMKKNNMKSYADVQMYFTNRMSGIVAKKGRRMMGWNEIYGHDVNGDGGGKAGTKLDTNAVIHFWKGNTDLAKNAIKDGHEVINSLHSSTYLDYSYGRISLQKAYGFEPIFPGLEEQYHSRVKGLGTQVWTEWIANTERLHHQAFPRACAFAEVGWTPAGKKDFPDFKKRLKEYSGRMDLMGIKYAGDVINRIDKSDFFNTPQIGTWTPDDLSGQEHSFDVTKLVKVPGKYTVTLLYDKGAHAIEIESVALYEGEKEIARDAHSGRSGTDQKNIQYILNVPEARQGASYTVKARFKGAGGSDSYGTVYCEAP